MYVLACIIIIRIFLGIPAEPSFGELTSGPNPGQVTIQIKTIASGVSDPAAQGFAFVIVPVLGSTPANGIRFPRPNYQSNMFETIMIGDLTPGETYTFSATAVSDFGVSTSGNSAPVQAGIQCHVIHLYCVVQCIMLTSQVAI